MQPPFSSLAFFDALLARVRMPPHFPTVEVVRPVDAGEPESWTTLKARLAVAGEVGAVVRVYADAVVLDLFDVVVNGDVTSDDPLLAVLDGLKKRTTWPEALEILGHVNVAFDSLTAETEVAVRIRWREAS